MIPLPVVAFFVISAASSVESDASICQDILHKPQTSITPTYNCSLSVDYSLLCISSDIHKRFTSGFQLTVLGEVPDSGNANITSLCLGVQVFLRSTFHTNPTNVQLSTFNSSVSVGTVVVERRCLEAATFNNCIGLLDIKLLDAFINISMYRFMPDIEDFWDFKSPLYRDWFIGLSIKSFGFQVNPTWVAQLQNTSVIYLEINDNNWVNKSIWVGHMRDLEYMDLSRNLISHFRQDCFIGLPSLMVLRLTNNWLKTTCPCFQYLTNVNQLFVSSDRDTRFQIRAADLEQLQSLEELSFSETRLYSIGGELSKLHSIKKLNLSNCWLQSLSSEAFINLTTLQILVISSNNLMQLEPNTFDSLYELTYLDLSNTELTQWPILRSMSLNLLNLSQNHLSNLNNLAKFGTYALILDVSSNNIGTWEDENMFKTNKNSSWIVSLDLSHNFIATVTQAMGRSLDAVRRVDLGGNPLDCADCNMPQFQHWLNTTRTDVRNLKTSLSLQCSAPYLLRQRDVQTVLFDEEACVEKKSNLWLSVGIPLGAIMIIITVAIVIAFQYRFQFIYMMHLYKIRRTCIDSKQFYNNCCYDAFICYSGQDRAWVMQHLVPALERGPEQYSLCLHERDFPLGSRIVENIVQSIETSRRTVVVLTQQFIDSEWCRWELEMANHHTFDEDSSVLVLLVLQALDRTKMPRHLKFLMDTRTYLEWPTDQSNEHAVAVACRRLRSALGPSIFQMTSEKALTCET